MSNYSSDMADQQSRRYTFPIIKHFFLWKLRRGIRKEMNEKVRKTKEVAVIMEKEDAIAFAKKYLEDRKDYLSCAEEGYEVYDIILEYVLLDIIPYLYGDALD